MIICATKCRWQHNQLSWLCSVHVTISSSAAHSRLRFCHFTALPFPCFHQGELFATVLPSVCYTRSLFAPWSGFSYTNDPAATVQYGTTCRGGEIQCGQMCNLGKSVDLILNLHYMLTHPTLWNQIFFSDLSKSERPHCLWVIVGRERPRQGDTITGNERQPGGKNISSEVCHEPSLFLAAGAGLCCSHQRFKVVSNCWTSKYGLIYRRGIPEQSKVVVILIEAILKINLWPFISLDHHHQFKMFCVIVLGLQKFTSASDSCLNTTTTQKM